MPIAKDTGGDYTPAPPGAHAAICCDVVDHGMVKTTWGNETKESHKVTIVWQIDEDQASGFPFRVQKKYTLSLHEKATLRKDLESWRGRPFEKEELKGFEVDTLIGVPALLNVLHNATDRGTYANVVSLMRLPKAMVAPKIRDYVRVKDREATKGLTAGPTWGDPTDDEVPF